MKKLDLETIHTPEQLQAVDFEPFAEYDSPGLWWIRHIKYPVSQKTLDRVCRLSPKLSNYAGELYLRQGN